MGCGQSKIGLSILFPHRRNKNKESCDGDSCSSEDGGTNCATGVAETSPDGKNKRPRGVIIQHSSGPLSAQTEVSSSQVDFFRMLDTKIDQGKEYDSDEDRRECQQRRRRLLRDWRHTVAAAANRLRDSDSLEDSYTTSATSLRNEASKSSRRSRNSSATSIVTVNGGASSASQNYRSNRHNGYVNVKMNGLVSTSPQTDALSTVVR